MGESRAVSQPEKTMGTSEDIVSLLFFDCEMAGSDVVPFAST